MTCFSRRMIVRSALAISIAAGVQSWRASAQSVVLDTALPQRAVDRYILPRMRNFAAAARRLATASPSEFETHFHALFDAWTQVEFLRFGPLIEDGRGLAIQFWPDPKGYAQRTISAWITDENPIVDNAEAFRQQSVAVRGLMGLEFLLFDPNLQPSETYRARLAQAIASALAETAEAVLKEWENVYAPLMLAAGAEENPIYHTSDEAAFELYKALEGGLQFLSERRLARPLGTFDRPRPRRAEAWRSGRSMRNIRQAIDALAAFYETVFGPVLKAYDAEQVAVGFERARAAAKRAPASLTDAVQRPETRVQIEAVLSAVEDLRGKVADHVGRPIGAGVGFNSQDGD